MKIHFVILGIGIFFLILGPSIGIFYTGSLAEKFPQMSEFISNQLLQPNQSVSDSLRLVQGDKFYLTILADPPLNTMFFSLSDPDNSIVKQFSFSDFVSFPIVANTTGNYPIEVGNIGNEVATVYGLTTINPILDDEGIILALVSGLLIGSVVMIIGVILIIVGIVIFVINKKRTSAKVNKK